MFFTFSFAIVGQYQTNAQILLANAMSNYTGPNYATTLTSVSWVPSVYSVSGRTNLSSFITQFTSSNQYYNFLAAVQPPSNAPGQVVPFTQNDFQQTIGPTIGIVVGVVGVIGILALSSYFIYKKRIIKPLRRSKFQKRVCVDVPVKKTTKVHAFEPIDTTKSHVDGKVEVVENEFYKKVNDAPPILKPITRIPSMRLTSGELNGYSSTPARASVVRPPQFVLPPPPPVDTNDIVEQNPVFTRFSSKTLPISPGIVSQRLLRFESKRAGFTPLQSQKIVPVVKPIT
jgi:hypothetical protein